MKLLTLNTQKAYQPNFKSFLERILTEETYDFIILQETRKSIIDIIENKKY